MSIKTVLKLDRLRKESEANYLEFLETYGFLQEEYMIAEIQILEAQEVPSSIIAKKRLQLKQLRKDMNLQKTDLKPILK